MINIGNHIQAAHNYSATLAQYLTSRDQFETDRKSAMGANYAPMTDDEFAAQMGAIATYAAHEARRATGDTWANDADRWGCTLPGGPVTMRRYHVTDSIWAQINCYYGGYTIGVASDDVPAYHDGDELWLLPCGAELGQSEAGTDEIYWTDSKYPAEIVTRHGAPWLLKGDKLVPMTAIA